MGGAALLRVVTALFVVLSAVAGPGAVTVAAEDVTLTVSVEAPDGSPVAGATLTAEWANGTTTETTASNGKAFLDVPKGADVAISVSHPEYVRNFPVEIQNATQQDVTVDVRPEGNLSVTVTDQNGPVEDARVILREEGRIVNSLRTNATGVVRFASIEQRDYGLTVAKQGYFTERRDVTVNGSNGLSVGIETGTVTLTVRAVDPHFDQPRPVGNATVRVGDLATVRTLENGRQTVSVPVNTPLTITATKEGYESTERTVQIKESDTTVNLSISRTPLLNLTPANDRIVAGEQVIVTVRDEYGDPVTGATVVLDGTAVGQTGEEGRLSVTIEEPGDHELLARTDSLESEPVTVRAIAEESDTATTTVAKTTTPPATTTEDRTDTRFPGFSMVTAIAALLVTLLAFRRRAA